MLHLIVEKELRLTLMTFKFTVCSLLLVVLMAASAVVLTKHWGERVDLYQSNIKQSQQQLREAQRYRDVVLKFERRPRLLSLLNYGVGDRYGRTIELYGKYDVIRLSGGMADNSYLQAFIPVDYARLVIMVVSVLALVISYDAINGDRCQGTLQLSLAYPVPRVTLLMGKYVGAFLSLLVPSTGATLIWLIIVVVRAEAAMGTEIWVRLAIAFALSLLYASAFIWLGFVVSSLTAQPSTSLIIALLIWTVAIVLYPPSVVKVVELGYRVGHGLTQQIRAGASSDFEDEAARDRAESAQWDVINRAAIQFRLAQMLLRLTPAAPYDNATAALTGTDLDGYRAWLSRARQTNETFRGWQNEKRQLYPEREIVSTNVDEPLDVTGLPTLDEPSESAIATSRRILVDCMLLFLYNLIFMLVAHLIFARYDVRL